MYDQVVKCQRAGLCLSEHFLINMLQCFSLVYSYMFGLIGLARCDLGLSHGLAGQCHSEASDVGLWI